MSKIEKSKPRKVRIDRVRGREREEKRRGAELLINLLPKRELTGPNLRTFSQFHFRFRPYSSVFRQRDKEGNTKGNCFRFLVLLSTY